LGQMPELIKIEIYPVDIIISHNTLELIR